MKHCKKCGQLTDSTTELCAGCNTSDKKTVNKAVPDKKSVHKKTSFWDILTGTINKFAGGTGPVHPPLKTIFGDIFKHHKRNEAEEIFICGTSKTTPELGEDGKMWPKTWLWTRILLTFFVSFIFLHICSSFFQNQNAFPGLMVIGSFAVPIAVLIFFFELNTPKNISFFDTIKYFMVGGCASLVATLFLYAFIPTGDDAPFINAVLIGCIEEVGKLIIVAVIILKSKKTKYALNGLLIGAAIGAGFAAFESAGYAFRVFLSNYPLDMIVNKTYMNAYYAMLENIYLRAFLAPGGHVIWAAMSGYALMLVKGNKELSVSFLNKKAFWMIFWIPIALHALWDTPLSFGNTQFGRIAFLCTLVILGWIVIFVMISNALGQIASILESTQKHIKHDP